MSKGIVYYQNGERIITAGHLERRMYIILEGSVSINLGDGPNSIEVAQLEKNDFFGEISLFNNTPRSATVVAIGDVKLVSIDNENQLRAFLMRNSAFAAKMVHILAMRLAKTDDILIGKIDELNRLQITRDV